MRRVIAVLVLAAGAWLAMPSGASAGTYDVYSCRLPTGGLIAAAGWTPYKTGPGTTSDGCATGGGLTAQLDPASRVSQNDMAGWVFDAPPDTTIANYSLHRSGTTAPSGPDGYGRDIWLYHDAALWEGSSPSRYAQITCLRVSFCLALGNPAFPLSPANLYERSDLRILRVFLVTQCDGAACAPTGEGSHVTIWAARVGLSDPSAPRFTREPVGLVTSTGTTVDGERPVTFAAEDRGGGIASVGFVVDGQMLQERPSQSGPSTCTRPFRTPAPCPLTLERTMTLDTTVISNGRHTVQVALTDAAGNRTLSAAVEVEVRNRGVPNGAGASQFATVESWFASRRSVRRTASVVSYGKTRAIAGRLTNEHGVGIGGASLDVAATTGRPGSRARVIGQVVTAADGAFSYMPRAGSSRRISVNYRAYTLDPSASAMSEVVMQTRAGLSFSVAPKRVSPRGTIRFKGRLRGGPGREGTQVVVYALGGRRARIPVATVRADSTGRFRYRYRFQNSSPGTTYRFRATMHAQRAYPYATGSSRSVTVRIK